jgi:hypothetical protein
MSETRELTGPLIRMLRQTGAIAIRMQAGKVKVRGGWMYLAPAGCADILCFRPGAPVTWIETKSLTGKLREAQESFRRDVEALGHRFITARTLDEGLDALKPPQ